MAAELTINKSLTANGTIKVDDKIAMSLFAEISTNGGNDRITQSIQDKDAFNKNKKRDSRAGSSIPGDRMGNAGLYFRGTDRQYNRGGTDR